MLALAIFVIFAVIMFLAVLAAQVFAVHQIAKRMKPGTHKIWPIGIVFLYVPLLTAGTALNANNFGSSTAQMMAFVNFIPGILPIAIVWWRFEYWDLSSESPVFGREAAERHARHKQPNQQRPVQ